jgi:hypothetical protein
MSCSSRAANDSTINQPLRLNSAPSISTSSRVSIRMAKRLVSNAKVLMRKSPMYKPQRAGNGRLPKTISTHLSEGCQVPWSAVLCSKAVPMIALRSHLSSLPPSIRYPCTPLCLRLSSSLTPLTCMNLPKHVKACEPASSKVESCELWAVQSMLPPKPSTEIAFGSMHHASPDTVTGAFPSKLRDRGCSFDCFTEQSPSSRAQQVVMRNILSERRARRPPTPLCTGRTALRSLDAR